MSSETKLSKSPYSLIPVLAYREGEVTTASDLPVHIATQPWANTSWFCLAIGGFFLLVTGAIHIERHFETDPSIDQLEYVAEVVLCVSLALLAAAGFAWKRVDELSFRRDGVLVKRRGLLGTHMRQAAIRDYRGVRATHRYIEDFESTTGTTYWMVELVHDDPALTVLLYGKTRDERSDYSTGPVLDDRTDSTDEMKSVAKQWSNDLELRLLPPSKDT